jgi:hypothetical protein
MGRPTGIMILAILQILAGLIYLIVGAIVAMVGGILGGFYGELGGLIGMIVLVLGVVEFIVAWGYLTRKGWARMAGLILAGIGVLEGLTTLPTGIITIALYAAIIYYLTRPNIVDWFAGRRVETAQTPPE